MPQMMKVVITLAVLLPVACTGTRPHHGLDTGDLRAWGESYPAAARWLALARNPEAIVTVWPEVEATGAGVDAPLSTPPVWVAAEMSILPPEMEREAWDGACVLLAEAPGAEQERVLGALSDDLQWISEWQSVADRLSRIDSTSEGLMAAAFEHPNTRDLFTPMLERRGLDPERISSEIVGGTMTSGEHMAMSVTLICALSQMNETLREAWFEEVTRRAPEIQL